MSIAGTILSVFCRALSTEAGSLTSAAMLEMQLLAGCLAGLAIEVPDHNFGSRCDKAFGYRKPQSRGATRHDGIAAIDVQLIHY